jgi:hypothetical protein
MTPVAEMNPHASRFDNPQFARGRLVLEHSQEILQSADDSPKGCLGPGVQDDYSSAALRGNG